MKTHRPRVSIGLPVYNGERFLEDAINSLLAQTYQDFELIISDNASADQTEQICRFFAKRDNRIHYCRSRQNYGAAWNFNHVFKLSQGEYFKWSAHDDICTREYIERCIDILDKMPSVILCYTKTKIINENGKYVRNYTDDLNVTSAKPYERFINFNHNFRLSNPMFGLVRAGELRETRLIGNFIASDRVLLSELALLGKFYEVSEYLFLRRDHPMKSERANPSQDELAAWYDPTNRNKINLENWRLLKELFISIARSSIPFSEKTYCSLYLAKRSRWDWKLLRNELGVMFKGTIQRAIGKTC